MADFRECLTKSLYLDFQYIRSMAKLYKETKLKIQYRIQRI